MPIPGMMSERKIYWQKHFAWMPVKTLNGKWRWLTTVMKSEYYTTIPHYPPVIKEYITVDDYVEAKLRGEL